MSKQRRQKVEFTADKPVSKPVKVEFYTKDGEKVSFKWEMRKIIRATDKKDLRRGDFEKVYEWFNEFKQDYKNIDLYDFLKNSDDWQLAQAISFNSNLSAPDAIHLASAMLGSRASYCQVLITHDELLSKEGKRIIQDNKLSGKLKIMSIAEVKEKFFKK